MRVLAVRDAARARSAVDVRRVWLPGSLILVLLLYLSTLQTAVNGSEHPYATDVGEIQNALPRWGTIHEPGYPLYSLGGSLFVTALRGVGVAPAAGASLYSALWGVAAVAVLYLLARELGVAPPFAAAGALLGGLTTSMWVDASLAEIHTMGAALTVAAVLFAARFRRTGARGDLLALVAALAHGVVHQRTALFLAPALLLLAWPRRREALGHWRPALAVALTAPLAYLYLLARGAMGSRWTFGAVGEWRGLLALALDSKVSKVVVLPGDLAGWMERLRLVGGLLHDDLWLPVLLLGLGGVWLLARRRGGAGWRVPLALTLAWLPSLGLSLVIWEGRVSDALLAAKLPLALVAGVGLAIALQALAEGRAPRQWAAGALAVGLLAAQVATNRPAVLAVTRDASAREAVAIAEGVAPPADGAPTTLMALWGHKYWALTYAQAYEGRLPGLTVVDHNADLAEIVRREGRILTLSETLYHLSLAGWGERLGRAHLSSPAPGIVEVRAAPILEARGDAGLDLANGVRVVSAAVRYLADGTPWLEVAWRAERAVDGDYSVAVHVLARPEPAGPQDVLAQADRAHPVDGWYPTSRWQPGEVIRDAYPLGELPPEARAVRLAMYRQAPDGGFETTPWLTVSLPQED